MSHVRRKSLLRPNSLTTIPAAEQAEEEEEAAAKEVDDQVGSIVPSLFGSNASSIEAAKRRREERERLRDTLYNGTLSAISNVGSLRRSPSSKRLSVAGTRLISFSYSHLRSRTIIYCDGFPQQMK